MKLGQKLLDQLASIAEGEGLEFVATEVVGSGPRTILRLVIDGPHGVSLDQCAAVSRQASALLDVEDPASHRYTLEVSSPGLDRKLYSEQDYRRFSGHRVRIRMQPAYREHRIVAGELLGLADTAVRIRCDSQETVELPMSQVLETRVEVDWDRVLQEGKHRR
jgi:ribosome maturation factor RimP